MSLLASVRQIQSLTGAIFGCYVILHLINNMSASQGPEQYHFLLHRFRSIYQRPEIELILLGSVVLHVLCGVYTHWKRNKFGLAKTPPTTWYLIVHRYTGAALVPMILVHVYYGRVEILLGVHPPIDFEYMHVFLNMMSLPIISWYTILSLVGIIHVVLGTVLVLEKWGILPDRTDQEKSTSTTLFPPTRATSPLVWLFILTIFSAVLSGILSFLWTSGDAAKEESWKPFLEDMISSQMKLIGR